MIYLDAAATTEVKKEVQEVITYALNEYWGNPSSLYNIGDISKQAINKARKIIADSINANDDEVIFTSCGSESNNMAIRGLVDNLLINHQSTYLITTKIEHKSIINLCDYLKNNIRVYNVKNNSEGLIDLLDLEMIMFNNKFKNNMPIVSIQFANNEIGTIQYIKLISQIVHKYNGILHVDATQAFGQLKINVKDLGIDLMTASGHKIGAPKGIAFLYIKSGIKLSPLIYGGKQEFGLRGGTENIPYILGMAKAVELINYSTIKNIEQLKWYMFDKITEIDPNIILNGSKNRLPNNLNITIGECNAEYLLFTLNNLGYCISTGSACNSGSSQQSHVLKAIGLTQKQSEETIRITLPDIIDKKEIDKFVLDLFNCCDILNKRLD